jgi:predicted HicB family RNase H-like nuclease
LQNNLFLNDEHPEKYFSGKFNLRLDPELHKQVYIAAKKEHLSLNQWIAEAIKHQIHHP